VSEVYEKVKENLEIGMEKVREAVETPRPFHELGARTGLVEPTTAEEIKFGAEKMGTAVSGFETKTGESAYKPDKSYQVWLDTQDKVSEVYEKVKENLEIGMEKVREAVETPRPFHELGARAGLVEPTMAEEVKFGAEKMGTAVSGFETKTGESAYQPDKSYQVWMDTQDKVSECYEKIKENLEIGMEKVKEATETPGPAHEIGARMGVVEPTVAEEIKFAAEKKDTTV